MIWRQGVSAVVVFGEKVCEVEERLRLHFLQEVEVKSRVWKDSGIFSILSKSGIYASEAPAFFAPAFFDPAFFGPAITKNA